MNLIKKFKNWTSKYIKLIDINGISFNLTNLVARELGSESGYPNKIKSMDKLSSDLNIINIEDFLFDLSKFLKNRRYQFINNRKDGNNNQPYYISISREYHPTSIGYHIDAIFRVAIDETGEEIPDDVVYDISENVKKYFNICKVKYTHSNQLYTVHHEYFSKRGYIIFYICLSY